MKFGIYSSIANPPRGEHLDRCIDEVIAEAQLAEDSGFDACFFGEHHQDQDGFLPSPLMIVWRPRTCFSQKSARSQFALMCLRASRRAKTE